MRPMRRAKRIIHVVGRKRRQLLGEFLVVRFFLRVKAQILEQQRLPHLQLRGNFFRLRSNAVGAKAYILAARQFLIEQHAQPLRHRLQEQGSRPVFRSGDLAVDLVRRIVTVGGNEVKLSPKEYDILQQLVIHAGKVLTHRHLLREVWGLEAGGDIQYLRVYIRQLRQKLEADPERPRHILTEAGVGYRLQDDR